MSMSSPTLAAKLLSRFDGFEMARPQMTVEELRASVSGFKVRSEWLTFVYQLAEVALAKGRSEPMQTAVKDHYSTATQY